MHTVCNYRHRHGEDVWLFDSLATAQKIVATRHVKELIKERATEHDVAEATPRILALIEAGDFAAAVEAYNDLQQRSADQDNFEFHELDVITDAPTDAPTCKCPNCGNDDAEEMEVMETFTAYHPIEGVTDGEGAGPTLVVINALGTTCPSEHFDDGASDYRVHCRACLHNGTIAEFGLPENLDWC